MCGIFGFALSCSTGRDARGLRAAMDAMFRISESRGKEAAGLAVRYGDRIDVFKEPLSASALIRTAGYRALVSDVVICQQPTVQEPEGKSSTCFIGHSRLVTDGSQGSNCNNQPVVKNELVGVHNGIITNVNSLWTSMPAGSRKYEVDTEVLLTLIERHDKDGTDLVGSVCHAFKQIEGSASLALMFSNRRTLLLATNTGSLYVCQSDESNEWLFMSERLMLEQFIEKGLLGRVFNKADVRQIKPFSGVAVGLDDLKGEAFEFGGEERPTVHVSSGIAKIIDHSNRAEERRRSLVRCSRCILPETFPFIEFDDAGVCNYCHDHIPYKPLGRDALEALVTPYRSGGSEPDCIIPFSGGRDSSYVLHYVKTELNMTPLAYTYDWGMVTDLARRNQARICGKLGIEHLLISADIRQKRKNIQRNIRAWLRRPHIGMVPLFMVGDKQYFYHADKLRKQTGVKLVVLGGNRYEKTQFKTGFMGVREGNIRLYNVNLLKKMRLMGFYLARYLLNPGYLNMTIFDTMFGFYSAYILKHDFNWFYDYIRWDEEAIVDALKSEYNWEFAEDTTTSWRIGDGTAAFYNHIYYTVAGFTEHDTFLSIQIRDGLLSREEALKRAEESNGPRYDSIRQYAQIIGFDCERALHVINTIPKLY